MSGNLSRNASLELNFGDDFNMCTYLMPFMNIKLFLVLGLGTLVAVVSMLQNTVVAFLFLRRRLFRESHLLYLACLAIADIVLGAAYLALLSLQILMEHLHSRNLSNAWHILLRPMYALSSVARATSSFLLIAATLERLLYIRQLFGLRQRITQQRRVKVAGGCLGLGLLFNGSTYWEFTSLPTNCDNHNFLLAHPSKLAQDPRYGSIWALWTRNFATVFVPFSALFGLNILVVSSLRAQQRRSSLISDRRKSSGLSHRNGHHEHLPLAPSPQLDSHRLLHDTRILHEMTRRLVPSAQPRTAEDIALQQSVRTASRMLVAIVGSYLIANSFNVFLTFCEHFGIDVLRTSYPKFYSIGSDVVSLLVALCGMLRLEIYCWCDRSVWQDLKGLVRRPLCGKRGRNTDVASLKALFSPEATPWSHHLPMAPLQPCLASPSSASSSDHRSCDEPVRNQNGAIPPTFISSYCLHPETEVVV